MKHRLFVAVAIALAVLAALPVAGTITSGIGTDTKCPKCCAACQKKETRADCMDCSDKAKCNHTEKSLCYQKCEDIG